MPFNNLVRVAINRLTEEDLLCVSVVVVVLFGIVKAKYSLENNKGFFRVSATSCEKMPKQGSNSHDDEDGKCSQCLEKPVWVDGAGEKSDFCSQGCRREFMKKLRVKQDQLMRNLDRIVNPGGLCIRIGCNYPATHGPFCSKECRQDLCTGVKKGTVILPPISRHRDMDPIGNNCSDGNDRGMFASLFGSRTGKLKKFRAAHPKALAIYKDCPQGKELSPFYIRSIFLKGIQWPSVEHYFHAQKFASESSEQLTDIERTICTLRKIKEVRDYAKKYSSHRTVSDSDWKKEGKGYKVMETATQAKFDQHDDLRALLLATKDLQLFYWGSHEFWCYKDGKGKNMYGAMLENVRSFYQALEISKKTEQSTQTKGPKQSNPHKKQENQHKKIQHKRSGPQPPPRPEALKPIVASQKPRQRLGVMGAMGQKPLKPVNARQGRDSPSSEEFGFGFHEEEADQYICEISEKYGSSIEL